MKALMKTTKSVKPAEVDKKWHLIDADGLIVGRLDGSWHLGRSGRCRGRGRGGFGAGQRTQIGKRLTIIRHQAPTLFLRFIAATSRG